VEDEWGTVTFSDTGNTSRISCKVLSKAEVKYFNWNVISSY